MLSATYRVGSKEKNIKKEYLAILQKGLVLCLLACLSSLFANAQILDDSTQTVYGPKTTKFTTYEQVKFGLDNYFPLDTMIDDLHKFGMPDVKNYLVQDLGFLGSATNPVFFAPPDQPGRTAGFPVYDLFFKNPEQFRYYDTKSPYTAVNGVFAGSNRTIVDVNYTRNVNPTWNVGFNFLRISAERQLDRQAQENRQTFSTYYDLYTHFQTKNKRYALLANAERLNHEVVEMGGIDTASGPGFAFEENAFFLYQDANVFLQEATTREYRFNINLYHHYQLLSKNVKIYHEMGFNTEKNSYTDSNVQNNRAFYRQVLINPQSTDDQFKFREFKNEVGLKGSVSNLFYLFFAKRRTIDFNQKYLTRDDLENEHSVGTYLRWQFDSLHYLRVNGELLATGEHLLKGDYKNRYFEASYKRIMSRPAYMQEAFLGNHHGWLVDFKPPQSDNIYASLNYELPFLRIQPFFRFSSIFNHIYFDEMAQPAQISGFAQIFSPGVSFVLEPLDHLFFDNTLIYTQTTGSSRNVFRQPELFANSDLYFQNHLFNSKMFLKLGIGANYKSPYLAPAYDPTIQNFYLQNDFWIPRLKSMRHYVLLNAYANVQIGNIRFFFRLEHINQSRNSGYFASPFFTGQPQTLNFGFRWMFFD